MSNFPSHDGPFFGNHEQNRLWRNTKRIALVGLVGLAGYAMAHRHDISVPQAHTHTTVPDVITGQPSVESGQSFNVGDTKVTFEDNAVLDVYNHYAADWATLEHALSSDQH
jgi:hypothetical protein